MTPHQRSLHRGDVLRFWRGVLDRRDYTPLLCLAVDWSGGESIYHILTMPGIDEETGRKLLAELCAPGMIDNAEVVEEPPT